MRFSDIRRKFIRTDEKHLRERKQYLVVLHCHVFAFTLQMSYLHEISREQSLSDVDEIGTAIEFCAA